MNSRSFFLAHAQDIVGIIAILFLLVDVFNRKGVSVLLRQLLRAKWQGSEMEDHVQPKD